MSKNTRLASFVVDIQANALAELLNNGFIDIYEGPQPESPDESVGLRKLCVSLKFGSPAFMPAVMGIISANPISASKSVADVNPATWARCFRADHKTAVMDVSAGTKDANIILPNTHIVRGITIGVSSFMHSVAKLTAGV
jgi:hypothetical protein